MPYVGRTVLPRFRVHAGWAPVVQYLNGADRELPSWYTLPVADPTSWLTTERLALRRFTSADLDWLATLYGDIDVMRFVGGPKNRAQVAELLRIDRAAIVDAAWADNGPGWIAVMLESAEAVLAVEPARHHPEHIDIGIVGPHAPGSEVAFEP